MARQDDWVRTQVRLPPELHQAIVAHAETGSINAAIIELLKFSLNVQDREAHRQALRPTVNILLDTDGMPISWGEISEHLSAISRELGGKLAQVQMEVITPEVLSSQGREVEADELARKYRKFRSSRRRSGDRGPESD